MLQEYRDLGIEMDANEKEMFGMMYFAGGIGVASFGYLLTLEHTIPGSDAYMLGLFAGVVAYAFWQHARKVASSSNGNSATKEDE
jgi:hypothetical protein